MSDRIPPWFEQNLMAVAPELRGTTLFRFNVRLQATDGNSKHKQLTVDMLPDLDLDYEILESQMLNFPAQYAYWATIYSEVRMNVAVAERKLKMRYGVATERIQNEFSERGIKPTAEVIKRIVEKDEDLIKADLEYQKLQMQAGKLYHMIEAIKAKIDIARSLMSFKRQEFTNT